MQAPSSISVFLLKHSMLIICVICLFSISLLSRRWSGLARVESILGLMTCSFIVPVLGLSWFEHQEARFLIPVTLPVVFLHAQRLRHTEPVRGQRAPTLLLTWYTFNIVLTVIYGFVHQAGVYPLSVRISDELSSKPRLTALRVVTSHMYPLPSSLLMLKYGKPVTQVLEGSRYMRGRDFFTEELGSSLTPRQVLSHLLRVRDECAREWSERRVKSRLYLVAPSSLRPELTLLSLGLNVSLSVDTVFYPHLSVEALPSFPPYPHSSSPLLLLSHLSHQLGLTLFRVSLPPNTP